jgi:hypothetical protein
MKQEVFMLHLWHKRLSEVISYTDFPILLGTIFNKRFIKHIQKDIDEINTFSLTPFLQTGFLFNDVYITNLSILEFKKTRTFNYDCGIIRYSIPESKFIVECIRYSLSSKGKRIKAITATYNLSYVKRYVNKIYMVG